MVELEALKQFKPGQAGRPRTKPPLWRESPSDGTFVMSVITVQVRTGQQGVLMERLRAMRQQKQHLFPGTVARYITEDDHSPGTIELQLIWKQSEMPGEETCQEALEAFRAAFKDVLYWQTAHYVTKTVLLHT